MVTISHFKPLSCALFFLLLMTFFFNNSHALPVPPKSNENNPGISTKPHPMSLRDAVTARMQQLEDRARIRNKIPTLDGEQNQNSPRKLIINNPVRVGLQEVSENPRGKTTLRKAASVLAKMKMMSAIHPKFSAVLLPEQSGEKSFAPSQPLTSINYRSSPLQGTEQYDREVARFKAPVPNIVTNEPVKHVDSVQTQTGTFVPKQNIDEARSRQSGRSGLSNAMSGSSASTEQSNEENSRKPVSAESISSMQSRNERKVEDNPRQEQNRAFVVRESKNSFSGDKKEKRMESSIPEQENAKRFNDSQKEEENKTISWKGFLKWAKAKMSGILKKKDDRQPKYSKKEKKNNPVGLIYTENDIKHLANDIVDVIRERSYQTYKQRDDVETTGKWNEDGVPSHGYDASTNGPMYLMNAKVLITPDLVSDAVKASAEKLLISKKLSSDTNQYKTSLTRKAQDNRAKPISSDKYM